MRITLIGLGKMGSVLAKRLLLANYELTVFNRTKAKMQPLIEKGAKGADNLKEAVINADVVITCLLDDNAVLQVTDEFAQHMHPQAIHLGTSTILPDTSRKLVEIHNKNKSIYIANNVLGVPKAAENGKLTSIIAGNKDAIEKCKPILETYSEKIIYAGHLPYQANVLKICMNYLLVSMIEAMGELYTFAEKSNVDMEIINNMFHQVFAHPAFKLYVDKIKNRSFDDVNFDLKGGFKDINLFSQAFASVGVVPSIANIIKDKYIIALARDMANQDWSALTEITRIEANIE